MPLPASAARTARARAAERPGPSSTTGRRAARSASPSDRARILIRVGAPVRLIGPACLRAPFARADRAVRVDVDHHRACGRGEGQPDGELGGPPGIAAAEP